MMKTCRAGSVMSVIVSFMMIVSGMVRAENEVGPYGGVNLIANGSFETQDGWSGDGGLAANSSTWISARSIPDGSYGYYLWHEEYVSRSFTVPEGQGGDYRLSFFYIARPSNDSRKDAAKCYSGNRVRAWVDGIEVGSVLTSYSYWEFVEFPVLLVPGEHTLRISGDTCNTGWDASAAIDCVALELPPDPAMRIHQPTISDYRARLAFNADGKLEAPGGFASEIVAATGEFCAGPDGVALTITDGGTYDMGETLNHSWSVAARFKTGENLGTVFALGTANITKALNFVVVNDATDHLSVRLYATWATGPSNAGVGGQTVEVGVPGLSSRFHSIAVVFRRVSNGNYSITLQHYDVYVDGVMVGQVVGMEGYDNRLYEYAGDMLQFGSVFGGNPNGLQSSVGHTFDDFRFYNRPLSPEDVRLYAKTFPACPAINTVSGDGATFIATNETLTVETSPEPCFNFGVLELTDMTGGTITELPRGPGVVRFTGNQTLAFTGLGNQPVELAGTVTLAPDANPLRFRSSPITVTDGTVTLAGAVPLGNVEDRFSINGGVLNVTGGTVSGGSFVFPTYVTDNTINISGGMVTSAVQPTGSTRQLDGHCVNVMGGVFAPSSLAFLGNVDPGVSTAMVVKVTGTGVFVPPSGMFPTYVSLRSDGVGTMRLDNETELPLYGSIPTRLEFVQGGRLVLDMTSYVPEQHVVFRTAGVVLPEGHSIAEFVQLDDENYQITLSDDGKSICAVFQDASVPFTATWVGGGANGVVSDAANWSCFNCNGVALPGAIPNRDYTVVTIPGNSNFACSLGQAAIWKSLNFDGPVELTADRDWRGLPINDIPAGTTIDLQGKKLLLATSAESIPSPFTVTDTVYGECLVNGGFEQGKDNWGGELNLAVKQKSDAWLGNNKMAPHSGGLANATWQNQSFSQTFTAKVGGRFELSFWHLPRVNYPVGHRLHVAIDGLDVATFDTEVASWVERRVAFDLSSGEHTLTLTGDRHGSSADLSCVTDDFSLRRIHQEGESELHVEVPEGTTFVNEQIALAGGVRLVKEGRGTFVGKRKSQSYNGGLCVAEGRYVVFNDAPDTVNWSPTRAYTLGAEQSAVTVAAGASLNIAGNYDLWAFPIVLNGGTIENDIFPGAVAAFDMTSESWYGLGNVSFGADARYLVRYDMMQGRPGYRLSLNGHTLTATIGSNRTLRWSSDMTNGTLKVEAETADDVTPSFRVYSRAVEARTVNLDISVPLDLAYGLNVSNYVSRLTAGDNKGTAALNVFGTFTPYTDRFYGCVLQDGSWLDLSKQPGTLWLASACSGELGTNVVSFAKDAIITVDFGDRHVTSGRVVAWENAPPDIETVKFKLTPGMKACLTVGEDGLYLTKGMWIIIR